MVLEIGEGRRPPDEQLQALKAEDRKKRDAVKQKVVQELQAGATTLNFSPEELEGLMNELTIMLIHKAPGGTMLDITPATTATIDEGIAKIQTSCHMRQNFMRVDLAFVNTSTYQNAPKEDSNQVVLTEMIFRPTIGEKLLALNGAEQTTRLAMENLHETIGDTFKVLTKGAQGIPPIDSPGIQLHLNPSSLEVRLAA